MDANGELVTLYLSECGQILQKLDAALLEADQRDVLSDSGELFRLLHTLKGSSSMMDYVPLADAAHAFENVLSAVKSRATALRGERLQAMIEAGLAFCMYFRRQFARIRDGKTPEADGALRQSIDALAEAFGISSPRAVVPEGQPVFRAESVRRDGERRLLVKLRACPIPHMRALLVAKSATALCSFLETEPDGLSRAAEYDAEILAQGFAIRFLPADGVTEEAIVQKIAAQPYVTSCVPAEMPAPDPVAETAQNVTVSQETINRLINQMDEIASAQSAVEAFVSARGLGTRQLDMLLSTLRHTVAQAGVLAAEIASRDIGNVFAQMQRAVRGMAKDLGKEIKVKTVGADVRVDKSVLEILSDSLIHVVRNAVDHGIELPQTREDAGKPRAGRIALTAAKKNDMLTVTVEDDGAGINRRAVLEQAEKRGKLTKPKDRYSDAETYDLLLRSGLSTSAEVTRYSGRGVGLDAVTRRIRQAGGNVLVTSREGRGTAFTLKIPITLTMIDGIEIVPANGERLIVPANAVRHILACGHLAGAVNYRGEDFAPLLFPGEPQEFPAEGGYALLLGEEYPRRYLRARTVKMMAAYYVKPMPEYVIDAMGAGYVYSGCVVGGDARLRCILDVGKLIDAANVKH